MSNDRTEIKRATRQSDTSSRLGIRLLFMQLASPYYSLKQFSTFIHTNFPMYLGNPDLRIANNEEGIQ